MNTEDLKQKLISYLEENNISYNIESLNYLGIRDDVPQPDGTDGSYHTFRYQTSIYNGKYEDSNATYYAYFDSITNKLDYILGPQSFKKIK